MRFDGVERYDRNWATEVHVKLGDTHFNVETDFGHGSSGDIEATVNTMKESVELINPTIARFHEAVAFLGAKLPPLKEGV